MKRLQVYWRNSPDDLQVLQAVPHIRFGMDGEEVLTTHEGADLIQAMAREFMDFWVEGVESISPREAVEFLLRSVPWDEVPVLLKELLGLIAREEPEAARALEQEYGKYLQGGA